MIPFQKLHYRAGAMLLSASCLLVLLCGCSSFNREWRQAGTLPTPEDSIEGRWEGRWLSDANGHRGKLLCIVSRDPEGITHAAYFRASYLKVLRFSYTVPLRVKENAGGWVFQGTEDLGAVAGGVYHYEGSATATNFLSHYRSQSDHGVFEMKRPPTKPPVEK